MPTPTSDRAFTGWIERLAREHTKALSRLALGEGLRAQDAIDAAQEAFITFLALPQARGLSEHPDDAFAFLSVIVRNAARNMRKRHHRTRTHVEADDLSLADEGPAADELIAQAEAHVAALGCVQQLAEIQRQVVTLRMMQEMSSAEVADALGLTPNHVGVLLHRAKSALRRCLAGERRLGP
jgi:RNA polymerase sigma-70 factor (ECF subfamily)